MVVQPVSSVTATRSLRPTLRSLREAALVQPEEPRALHAYGARRARRGEHIAALPWLERAIELERGVTEFYDDAGQCLLGLERSADAARVYESALQVHPEWAAGYRRLGTIYRDHFRDVLSAVALFGRSLQLRPTDLEACAALASCLIPTRSAPEAVDAVTVHVGAASRATITKGVARALGRTGRYSEAIQIVRDLVPGFPCDVELLGMLADFSQVVHDWGVATEFHERALALDSGHAVNCFYYWIKIGALDRAAAVLGLRSDDEVLRWGPPDDYVLPRWNRQPLAGKRVLLHTADFGSGDALQFCRFAIPFHRRGAAVFAECSLSASSLIGTVPGTQTAFGRYEQAPEVDYESDAFFDLCFFLNERAQSMGGLVPYFFPEGRKVDQFRKLVGSGGKLKVGLNWAGSRWWKDDPYSCRSLSLQDFAGLAEIPGIELYSLQKGPGAEALTMTPAPFPFTDLGRHFHTFEDTAAAMVHLDLIISADTSVAHLAGGLGRPVYVLLPFNACFRWGVGRSDCDWYPTMTLFRQARPGVWKSAVDEMLARLRELIEETRSLAAAQ